MAHLLQLLIRFYVFPLTSWWLTILFVAVMAMYGWYALMYSHGQDRRRPIVQTIGFILAVWLWPAGLVVLPVMIYRRDRQLGKRYERSKQNARITAESRGRE